VDVRGRLFVADTGNDRVEELSSNGTTLGQWGTNGSDLGQFDFPSDVAVDSHGNIYVADEFNNRIQILSSTGKPLAAWRSLAGRRAGAAIADLRGPVAVTVDARDHLYVVDALSRVIKLSSLGKPVAGLGTTGIGVFKAPSGVAVDARGNVFVADTGNNRVRKFSPG
jgi:DNA-binding beta-propeller fold protein YncE